MNGGKAKRSRWFWGRQRAWGHKLPVCQEPAGAGRLLANVARSHLSDNRSLSGEEQRKQALLSNVLACFCPFNPVYFDMEHVRYFLFCCAAVHINVDISYDIFKHTELGFDVLGSRVPICVEDFQLRKKGKKEKRRSWSSSRNMRCATDSRRVKALTTAVWMEPDSASLPSASLP